MHNIVKILLTGFLAPGLSRMLYKLNLGNVRSIDNAKSLPSFMTIVLQITLLKTSYTKTMLSSNYFVRTLHHITSLIKHIRRPGSTSWFIRNQHELKPAL